MQIRTLDTLLRGHPFFQGLNPDQIDFLTGCSSEARFEEGDRVFSQGQAAERFYLIRHGRISVGVMTGHPNAIPLQTLSDGDVLGWSWLFPPYRYHLDATALEMTRVIVLDGRCVREKCESDPRLGYELMKRFHGMVVDRLQAAHQQLIDLHSRRR